MNEKYKKELSAQCNVSHPWQCCLCLSTQASLLTLNQDIINKLVHIKTKTGQTVNFFVP